MKMPRNANDVLIKHLSGALPAGVLEVIGVHDVEIERALPTEQNSVQVKQEFTDIVWELRDGTILHLEVQTRKPTNLHRFLHYDAWLAEHFQTRVRTVILYNAAVAHAPDCLDIGCAQYKVENVYLKALDGDDTLETVATHLANGTWEPADRIRLALALQMRHSQSADDVLERTLALTKKLDDEYEQAYVTTLILGINGNQLSKAQRERLREGLKMTSIVKEIWHDGLDEGMQKGIQKGIEKGIEKGIDAGKKEVARAMLARGMEISEIADLTGLSLTEVEALRDA
ncbi:MAG: Rpn family recombination-promoting nuclease/putative transposase [Firmicutes bacterium]|nr:Rpn family recombination-promoting nuclease/putative transposase [Bacillota bacterium]